MSCHDIGHGLNSVVEVVLKEYDDENIDFDTAKRIICQARDAVHYCDGNEYEALECFEEQIRCTCCLKQVDNLYNLYALPKDLECYQSKLKELVYREKVLGGYICESCLKELCR